MLTRYGDTLAAIEAVMVFATDPFSRFGFIVFRFIRCQFAVASGFYAAAVTDVATLVALHRFARTP